MEHFYQNIYGWFNYEWLFSDVIKSLSDGAHIIEIGAYKGKSCAFMAVEIINSGKKIQYDIIDSWNGENETSVPWAQYRDEPEHNQFKPIGDIFQEFKSNLSSVWHVINPIQSLSAPTAKLYKDNSLDFVFIDGDHSYEGCKKDIEAWYPKMKTGGIMAGDDLNPSWGVQQACEEFFGKENIQVINAQWIVKINKEI